MSDGNMDNDTIIDSNEAYAAGMRELWRIAIDKATTTADRIAALSGFVDGLCKGATLYTARLDLPKPGTT